MRARGFLILCAITVAVSVAAGVAVVRQERPQTVVETGGPMFPGLVDRLNDVSAIVIRDATEKLTIRRSDTGWGLAERNDYPVNPVVIRDLVRSLVELEKTEGKTLRAERYARLGVEDVDAAGATSREVTLQTAAGTPVAQLIIGNPATGAGAEGGTYVRIPGEQQAWLARGTLSASAQARDWVERQLIAIPEADIRQIRIVHPDKSTITIVRDAPDAPFRLLELPANSKQHLKRPDAITSLTEAFSSIIFDDLAAGGTEAFPADKTIRVTVTSFDGSVVAFDVAENGSERWVRFADGKAPATLPANARALVYRIPAWKLAPLERKLPELLESTSGS